MRLLFTSDTQLAFDNLQENEIALEELLASAAKYKPAAIIHAGDVKDAYSPIDVMVLKAAVRMVRRIRAAGHRLIILLGNHDRVSQSAESKNWLDVLQAAGAEIVTKPKIRIVAGVAIAFLPYIGAQEWLVNASKGLLRAIAGHSDKPRLLVFHAEVAGACINSDGRIGKGISPDNLGLGHRDADYYYDAAFGGHIHEHQPIEEVGYYIGSPFCQSWNEANSRKGHILVTVADKKNWVAATDPLPNRYPVKVKQIATSTPGWYDAAYLEKWGLEPEDGAYVRSKVTVTSKKIAHGLREEDARIRAKYPNVRTHIVPVLAEDEKQEIVLSGVSDRQKVEQYVAATINEIARFEPTQAVGYMTSKLDGLKEGAAGSTLTFDSVEAKNVLVFDDVKIDLRKQGLVLIRGENKDVQKRSNGAGKTSLLSLLPIALSGQTGKGQKSDAWASERNEETATVVLKMRDAAGRKIEVERGRRPHLIRLRIDGVDKSSGIRGIGKNETQGLIEAVSGFDLRMLFNAVYIDQSIANGFVFGSPSQRMDLIGRFQNLERFDVAMKAVNDDLKTVDSGLIQIAAQIDSLAADTDDLRGEIEELESEAETEWAAKLKQERGTLDRLIELHASQTAVAKMYEEMQEALDELIADRRKQQTIFEEKLKIVHVCRDRVSSGKRLREAKKCPTCGQPSVGVGSAIIAAAQNEMASAQASVDKSREVMDGFEKRIEVLTGKIGRYQETVEASERDIKISRKRIDDLDAAAQEEAERNKNHLLKITVKTAQLQLTERYHRAALSAQKRMGIEREMLEFAKKGFHRSGMPLYLSTALCPVLNRAAEEYSEIFADGAMKVVFKIENGEFLVDVVNPSGSSTIQGQSVGESAVAGVIAAFAVREVAPKTNLLILDEPGSGLDPENCKMFAKGITRIKERFDTILLVTHSPFIQAILSGEKIWTVIKEGGISTLSR